MTPCPKPFLQPKPEYRRIERVAIETLEECRKKLELTEFPLPIPVEQWIEYPLGITFGVEDLSRLGERTLGAAFITEREILVSEKLQARDGPFRFTCCHELGHILLHQKVARTFNDSSVGTEVSDKVERQADRFAAAFLMPMELLIRELFEHAELRGLDVKRCLGELLLNSAESEWLWRTRFIPFLTKRFGVSLSALLNRFSDLKLPDGGTFLPRELRERLLRKAVADTMPEAFTLVAGFPAAFRSDLFARA